MQVDGGIPVGRVFENPDVRGNDRIDPQVRGQIYRIVPAPDGFRLRIGIDGHKHSDTAIMRVAQAFICLPVIEVQPGEVAGVGLILEADIDGVSACINRGAQHGSTTCRAYEFHSGLHCLIRAPLGSARYLIPITPGND